MDKKEYIYKSFLRREDDFKYIPYNSELAFNNAVKNGDVDEAKRVCLECSLDNNEGKGVLSKNPIRNMKYHFIVTITLMTRFCIEGGMEESRAYYLSDLYIQKADDLQKADELVRLRIEATLDFTNQMKALKKEKICSKPVVQCINYIYENLHKPLSGKILAEYTGLNRSYLSRLFKQETGKTIGEYILGKKIEASMNMLKYSDYSFSDIANFLNFSSQSHFIKVFHEKTSFTPKKFRDSRTNSTMIKTIV